MIRELNEDQAFTDSQVKLVAKQVSQGLKYMKNKGIIHCDIKPENILFTDDSTDGFKIIDFGNSCESYKTGFSYVQSRMYRAPEIVLGVPYGHPIDMWSLGCVLFEMVNGTPLFPAKDERELLEYFKITLGDIPTELI